MAVLASGLAFLVIVFPQPVPPSRPPHLTLDQNKVRAQLGADARDAQSAPSANRTSRIDELMRARNLAEQGPGELPRIMQERSAELRAALGDLEDALGANAVWALRAKATEAIDRSLDGDLAQVPPELWGSFAQTLEAHGLVVSGQPIAPRLCIRALFKTRWNVLMGREKLERLSDIELQAFWGWLALEDPLASLSQRASALDAYARAGGANIPEARATLFFLGGQRREAFEAFDTLFRQTGNIRYRNHALAAQLL